MPSAYTQFENIFTAVTCNESKGVVMYLCTNLPVIEGGTTSSHTFGTYLWFSKEPPYRNTEFPHTNKEQPVFLSFFSVPTW